jgi:hypothetical protein
MEEHKIAFARQDRELRQIKRVSKFGCNACIAEILVIYASSL